MKSTRESSQVGAQTKADETGRPFGAYEIGGCWRFGSKSWIDGMDTPPNGLEWFYPQSTSAQAKIDREEPSHLGMIADAIRETSPVGPTSAQRAEIDPSTIVVQPLSPHVRQIDRIIDALQQLRQLDPPFDDSGSSQFIIGLRLKSVEREVNAAITLCHEAELRVADEATKQQ